MNIKELQIDDWVMYNGYPCKIYSLQGAYPREGRFNDKSIVDVWVGNGFLSVGEDEIEPISLTTEILEKNGFIQDGCIYGDDGYRYLSYNLNDSQLWGYMDNNGFDIAFGGINQCYGLVIKYVHELQHALRLCGLDELADSMII